MLEDRGACPGLGSIGLLFAAMLEESVSTSGKIDARTAGRAGCEAARQPIDATTNNHRGSKEDERV